MYACLGSSRPPSHARPLFHSQYSFVYWKITCHEKNLIIAVDYVGASMLASSEVHSMVGFSV